MAESIDAKEKSDADLVAEQQEAQDKAIEKAIIDTFQDSQERLTLERINNLKAILNDIINAKKENQERDLQDILESEIIGNRRIEVDKETYANLLSALGPEPGVEVKNGNVIDVAPLQDDEAKEVKEVRELGADSLAEIYKNKKLILGLDKILEEKKRNDICDNLALQDKTVVNDFAVGVRTILDKNKNTSGVKVNKYATSGAVVVGGTCLGTGIHLIVVAGSIAAAGAFPIGLAVLGGVLIIGAGIYYAHKKRERIAKFLPALYAKSKNTKDMRIEQLDGEERHKKLASLTKQYDKNNEKNKELADKKIAAYKKKCQPEYNRINSTIKDCEDELKAIKEMLEDASVTDFQEFKRTHKSRLNNVNVDIKTVKDLKSFKRALRGRESYIRFGRLGDVEETFKKLHEMYLAIDNFTDFEEFKKKYASEHSSNFENFQNFKDLKLFKEHLKKSGFYYTVARTGSLVQLNESKIDWERDQEAFAREMYASLEKQNKINATRYKKDCSLIENKTIKLRWYKQIAPYFAYWATNIAINFRSNAVALREFTAVVEAGVAQTSKVLKEKGSDPSSIPEFQTVEKIAENIENARDQFEERVGKILEQLDSKLSGKDKTDFFDYLKIEECYLSEAAFDKQVKRLVSGDKIKNIMLKIFYTHPSTVLSLLDESTPTTIKNINEALDSATENLLKFPKEISLLDSLQVYFPPENNDNYERFMLVGNEQSQNKKPQEATDQEALFEHILAIKRSIMEVNKTLQAVPKVPKEELGEIKQKIQAKITLLIEYAMPALQKIEEQFEKLDIAQEANSYREAYLNIFREFSDPSKLDECIEQANFSDVILLLESKHLKEFAKFLKNNKEKNGVLKEFFEIFESEFDNNDFEIPHEKRLELFQKAKAAGEKDKQLAILQAEYEKFAKGKRFPLTNLHKLNGKTFTSDADLSTYIKNNEHIYLSQSVLIDQKRGVLEEMQKSLVLSIPEIETTLESTPTYAFKRIAKKRKVSYGVPYNPSMSFSMDYISNLFKSAKFAFGEMKRILFDLKFSEMTIGSINLDLTNILNLVGDKSIPGSIDNVWKILMKIKGINFPGFDVIFGSFFGKVEEVKAILNSENQEKIVSAIKGLRDFLDKIPLPFKNWTFPDLIAKIRAMSLEIGDLSFRLSQLQRKPYDYNNALEMKKIILRLKALKVDFDKLNINLGDINLRKLVMDLPDGFSFKNELSDFVVNFDPFFDGLKDMDLHFKKFTFLGDFPFDDFLYVCNCFKEFGGFKKIMIEFPKWIKKYAEYEKEIEDMEKGNRQWDKERYEWLKMNLGNIKLNLEKFKKLKIHIGNLAQFSSKLPSFEFPDLGLPGLTLSSEMLKGLSLEFDKFGDISFDDISFIINFFGKFNGIDDLNLNLKGLMELINKLKFDLDSLKNLKGEGSEKRLKELKDQLEAATKKFEMFNDFSLRIGKFSGVLAKLPGIPDINLPELNVNCKQYLDGMRTGLKSINLSIDFYSGMNNIKSAFSGWSTKGLRLELDINSLWPSFSKEKQKKGKQKSAKNKTDSSSGFNLDFGDVNFNLNLKAIELDEIIRRVEALKALNQNTRDKLVDTLEKLNDPEVKQVQETIGFGTEELEKTFKENLEMVYHEVDAKLGITLLGLYTLRATIAVVNAIKRGDGKAVAMELLDLVEKASGLNNDIKLIVDELNMLKEFGKKTGVELEKIEELKKKLASKEQDLKNIRLDLLELKRLKEAFFDPKITINYEEPPISDMMNALGVDKAIVEGIIEQAKGLATDTIDSTVAVVQLSEIAIKLVPLVDVIQNVEHRSIELEIKEFVEKAARLKQENKISQDNPIENIKEKLVELNNVKKKLLELNKLINLASEIPNVDFTLPPYSVALQSFGLSGDMVKSVIENAKKIQNDSVVGIDNGFRNLELAEVALKASLLHENIAIITRCFTEHKFLKFLHSTIDSSNLDDIVEAWRHDSAHTPLNFLELRDAAKNTENLLNELDRASRGSEDLNKLLQEERKILNLLSEKSNVHEVNRLFSDIHDFTNVAAIVHAQAKADELEAVFGGLTGAKIDDSSQALIEPDEFIKRHKGAVDELVASNKDLMEKFHDYHSFVRISNKLRIKLDSSGGKLEAADFDDVKNFKELRQDIMGFEKDLNIFLKYKELITELLKNVSLPEIKADDLDDSIKNVIKLKNFLEVLDNFYILNNPQIIHQNLESANSVYQRVQNYDIQQPAAREKPVLHHFKSKRNIQDEKVVQENRLRNSPTKTKD